MYFGYDYEQKVSEFHPRIVSLEQRNNETKEDVLKFLRGNIVGQGKGDPPWIVTELEDTQQLAAFISPQIVRIPQNTVTSTRMSQALPRVAGILVAIHRTFQKT